MQVFSAIRRLVKDEFPGKSASLPRGSVAAARHKAELLGLLDALVAAAEAGADVTGVLQVGHLS